MTATTPQEVTREYLPAGGEAPGRPGRMVPDPGWFKAMRFSQMPDLAKQSRTAFILAYALAFRARWNPSADNPYNLEIREAVCDYANWGLSEQEFKTAKLEKASYATFRATSRGTIGKLTTARLFSILPRESNEQSSDIPRSDLRADLRAESKGSLTRQGLSRSEQPVSAFHFRFFRSRCRKIAKKYELDPVFVEAFIEQHKRDGCTIPDRITRERKPIRNVEKALRAFCDTLEAKPEHH